MQQCDSTMDLHELYEIVCGMNTAARVVDFAIKILTVSLVSMPFMVWYHAAPLPAFWNEWLAATCGWILVVLVCVKRWQWRWQWSGLLWHPGTALIPELVLWLAGFAVFLAVQFLFVQISYHEFQLLGIGYILLAVGMVWCGSVLVEMYHTASVVRWVSIGLIVASLWNILWGGWQIVDGSILNGAVAQANHFTSLVLCGGVSLWYLYRSGRIGGQVAALSIVLFISAVLVAHSRLVYLHLALVCSIGYCTIRFYRIAIPVLIVAVCTYILLFDNARTYMYHNAILAFIEHPLFGVGFSQYSGSLYDHAIQLQHYARPGYDRHSHNLILQLLAETGVLGTALILLGIGRWILESIWHHTPTEENYWLYRILTILLIHSMVEYPLWHADFIVLAALLLGMGCCSYKIVSIPRGLRVIPFIVLLTMSYPLYNTGLNYLRLDYLLNTPNIESMERMTRLLSIGTGTLLTPYIDLIFAAVMPIGPVELTEKIELNTRILHSIPTEKLAYNQVELLQLAGKIEESITAYKTAQIIFPQVTPPVH